MHQDVAEVVRCLLDFAQLSVKVGLMNSDVSFKDGDLAVDVVVVAKMTWIIELISKDLDGCSIFSDAILSCGTNFSSRTKMMEMDGSVLPEGNVHLGDVLEPIDVQEGTQL